MKRLVWLLLAVVSTALAQVQPVELRASATTPCCCCETPNACGMPDCTPPVAGPAPVFATAPASRLLRLQERKASLPARREESVFFVSFVAPATAPVARSASLGTRPAGPPLFKAHCSFRL